MIDPKSRTSHAQHIADTQQGIYVPPAVLRLGRLDAQTASGSGNTIDGSPQPPQAFTPGPS